MPFPWCGDCGRIIPKIEERHRHARDCPHYRGPDTVALESPWDECLRLMQERSEIQEQIVSALAHYPRGEAMHLIMGWMPLAYLKEIAPTLGKTE